MEENGESDPFLDFFNFSKPLRRVTIPVGVTQGAQRPPSGLIVDEAPGGGPRESGFDYAADYRKEEEIRMLREEQEEDEEGEESDSPDCENLPGPSVFGTVGDVSEDDIGLTHPVTVYKAYDFTRRRDTGTLAIDSYREHLIDVLSHSKTAILKGFTGCGKSTQAPQFVLDHYHRCNLPCNVIVTQPRRIAARSLAKRVCAERKWEVGSVCGYQVGLEKKLSEDTRLTYMTTGVLLQKLIHKKHMRMFTHVFLDEVHERDQNMDIAMLFIRKLLRTNSQGVKVILMSATIDVEKFAEYFSCAVDGELVPAPIIEVEKRNTHVVQEHYLMQLRELGEIPDIRIDEPRLHPEVVQIAVRLIEAMDRIEVAEQVPENQRPDGLRFAPDRGATLMFLPGLYEIDTVMSALEKMAKERQAARWEDMQWTLIPLHSSITDEEQQKVFDLSREGFRKIILATNIAESSITVPDIKYVIDFCLTKVLMTDPDLNMSLLRLEWAAKTNCKQRTGRVGRVSPGRVYRMVPQDFYQYKLQEEPTPEILRSPLEQAILHIKMLQLDEEPKALLALALDPPDISAIQGTILLLKEAGALKLTQNGRPYPYDGDLTFLGKVMANLPCDIRISKLIVMGYIFNVLEDSIIIGATLSLKSLFSNPFRHKLVAYHSRFHWADGSFSDCLAMLWAYRAWEKKLEDGEFANRPLREKTWCKRFYLQEKVLSEVRTLKRELMDRLSNMGIKEYKVNSPFVKWEGSHKGIIMKLVLAGAFYPNYFLREAGGGGIDEVEAVRLLIGRDPACTVILNGMPTDQPGCLYEGQVKKLFSGCAPYMRVSFDSSRVFLEFPLSSDENFPEKIATGVYKALKMKQCEERIAIDIYAADVGKEEAAKLEQDRIKKAAQHLPKSPRQVDLPELGCTIKKVTVVEILDPSRFFVQFYQEPDVLVSMECLVNELQSSLHRLKGRPVMGALYMAPWDGKLYRAQPRSIQDDTKLAEMFFIDYGSTSCLPWEQLREVPETAPDDDNSERYAAYGLGESDPLSALVQILRNTRALAVECRLAEVGPNPLCGKQGKWAYQAKAAFRTLVHGSKVYAEVYSVVNGVVALEILVPPDELKHQESLEVKYYTRVGQVLIESGYAIRIEESYLSKKNHSHRMKRGLNDTEDSPYYEDGLTPVDPYTCYDPTGGYPDLPRKGLRRHNLRGPESPLEMRMSSPLRMGEMRPIIIEQESVNSILLDSEPSNPHSRLMVAAKVGLNPSSSKLMARQTTLMPAIPGLPAIVAMLFAPCVELRTNADRTRYTGALCGLGYQKENRRPLFPDHDMEIPFDVIFDEEDIRAINMIRLNMSNGISTDAADLQLTLLDDGLATCQGRIKDLLFQERSHPGRNEGIGLLMRQRVTMDVDPCRHRYTWGLVDERHEKLMLEECENEALIFRMHPAVQLVDDDGASRLKLITDNLAYLTLRASESQEEVNTVCHLCGKRLLRQSDILFHQQSAGHREKEAEFRGTHRPTAKKQGGNRPG